MCCACAGKSREWGLSVMSRDCIGANCRHGDVKACAKRCFDVAIENSLTEVLSQLLLPNHTGLWDCALYKSQLLLMPRWPTFGSNISSPACGQARSEHHTLPLCRCCHIDSGVAAMVRYRDKSGCDSAQEADCCCEHTFKRPIPGRQA